jgi:hypothetical protein
MFELIYLASCQPCASLCSSNYYGRTLFLCFFMVVVVATASAQGGWDSLTPWGAPKTAKKKETSCFQRPGRRQNRPGSEKCP